MTLTKYKLKITVFILAVLFITTFILGSLIVYFYNIIRQKTVHNRLNHIIYNIKQIPNNQFKNILKTIDELNINNIIGDIVGAGKKEKDISNYLKQTFGTKFVNIYDVFGLSIYTNFDENLCGKQLICKTIEKNDIQIKIGMKNNNLNLKTYMLLIIIFSTLISIFFFPLIFWIVSKLTKPIEENIKFMKNFINNVSHELKTPLANINLASQILQNKKIYDENIIKQIISESKKLSNIIDTISELSALSKFQKKDKVKLDEIIKQIIKKFENQIKEKNIKLSYNLDKVERLINKNQFEILFSNLLSNAIKHNIKNGKINITLTASQLTVENTGKGIPKTEKNKIFDLFYRLNKNSNGHGLGLALVKKIVEINKRKIDIESKNGINKFIIKF